MKAFLILFIGFIGFVSGFSQTWKTYPYTPPGSLISFPVDEGRHVNEPVEWWYTSGHLTGINTGKHYSFMLAYFHFPVGNIDGFRILNFSDDDSQIFHSESKILTYNMLATDKLEIEAQIQGGSLETWKNKYNAGQMLAFQYELSAVSEQVQLNLDYDTFKRPLILGDDGYLLQAATNYTYYYSQTGIDITGTITYNGMTEPVSGMGWIDRQYGDMNPYYGVEYEWFSIQLSNGMDLNLWNIFENNQIPDDERYKILAAYVDDDTQYTTAEFQLERLSYDYTPDLQRCYAQSWHLTSAVNDVDLTISTLYSDSEVQVPFRFYEGSTVITGTVNGQAVTGQGFAELLHSYQNPQVSIDNNTAWNINIPLQWHVVNPDDGNPLVYTLSYSTDQNTYQPIAEGLTGTQYLWNNTSLADGDVFWIKLTAQSVDGTLTGTDIKEFHYDSTASMDLSRTTAVNIYPNPGSEYVIIQAKNIKKIEIVDINGQIIFSQPVHNATQVRLNTDTLRGIYLIKIYTGKATYIRKYIAG